MRWNNMSYVYKSLKKIVDTFMKIVWFLKDPIPGWSEVLQMAYKEDNPVQTSVIFLPMIDLIPFDPSCIYSTM